MTRILIADDHAVVRRGLRDILAETVPGCEIVEAGDSATALQLLAQQGWDLMLLDINMPGRSGLEVLGDARRLHPRLPVLVLSVHPEEEFAVRAFRLGASGYVHKQSEPEGLVVAVRRLLVGGRYVSGALAERLAGDLAMEDAPPAHVTLSARELEVLRRVALGDTIKEIAAALALSEKTVATYRARVATKLSLSTNVELARYALKHRLVD